ncbi:MAG: alkaline phosphatase family protein [Anaerolineales bacterium]
MDLEQMASVEQALRAARWPDLPELDAPEFVLPWYSGRSLANVPATVGALLGTRAIGGLAPLDELYWRQRFGPVEHVVLVLIDALGYLQLRTMLAREPESILSRMAERGTLLPMTSVCPSTTVTALTTLGPAESPAVHGVLGYELWLREYGVLTEMIGLKPVYSAASTDLLSWGFQPEAFVPVPGLGHWLAESGVRATAHVAEQFVSSGLTRMCYRGYARVIGHQGLPSLWENLGADLAAAGRQRSFHYVYWGGIDHAIHLHGADTPDWPRAYREIGATLGDWLERWLHTAPVPNTLLLVCADHGFVSTPEDQAYVSEGSPLEAELLVPSSGEARCAYLHTLAGPSPETRARLSEALGPDYSLIETPRALRAGLFGPGQPCAEAPSRLGHYVAVAHGQHYIDRLRRAAWMRGRHGGLAAAEMLVPWLAVRADALL